MKGTFRQSMAWLHTWCGLWLGWLLFAIFLTGTLAVFHDATTRWMQPERLVAPAMGEPEPALAHAQRYLAQHAPDAALWQIELPGAEDAALHLHWPGQEREVRLDPVTGGVLPPARDTEGGHHFVHFHYELHAGMAGVWIVSFAAMAMLAGLVSGIVTHRRFFKDFFTFRPGKGQRSWLDAHNALGVMTLPFLFVITYSGLVIWWPETMPAGVRTHYAGSESSLFEDLGRPGWMAGRARQDSLRLPSAALAPLGAVAADARDRMAAEGAGNIESVLVTNPGRKNSRIVVKAPYRFDGLTFAARREYRYDGVSGAWQSTRAEDEFVGESAASAPSPLIAASLIRTLHLARFGGDLVKWLYFACGLAATAMIGTGLLLFSVKRRTRMGGEFGAASALVYRIIDRLHVAAIPGLAVACVAYLWGNRLLPTGLPERHEWELALFFAIWAIAAIHALATAAPRAWVQQLTVASALCIALPLLNALTTGWFWPRYLLRGAWQEAGVELTVWAFGALLWWAARKAGRSARLAGAARKDGNPRAGASARALS